MLVILLWQHYNIIRYSIVHHGVCVCVCAFNINASCEPCNVVCGELSVSQSVHRDITSTVMYRLYISMRYIYIYFKIFHRRRDRSLSLCSNFPCFQLTSQTRSFVPAVGEKQHEAPYYYELRLTKNSQLTH